MRYISIVIATLCVVLSSTASAQTSSEEIEGVGTPNFIARFTGTHRIGNSNIFQSLAGDVGIGTTTPNAMLEIVDFRNSIANGVGPSAILGSANCTLNNFCSAVRGDAHSGFNIGVLGVNYALDGQSGGGGVRGQTFGTTGFTYGVQGSAEGTTGNGTGVFGRTASPSGNGVVGNNEATTGGGGNGVVGTSAATTGGGGGVMGVTNSADFGFSYATRGTATASTGSALGIFGEVFSPDAAAGYFLNRGGGNIIVGHTGINDTLVVFRVDGTGRVFADGGFQPSGADFAESMAVTGDHTKYAAGDLLVIDPTANRRVALAQQPYSTLVAGIYSTKPGMLATTRKVEESAPQNEVPLAVVGIVPCKATAENGSIKIGDLLVSSSTAGHAMKGTDRSKMLGAVVGKALEPLQHGTGVIQVLVTLQ